MSARDRTPLMQAIASHLTALEDLCCAAKDHGCYGEEEYAEELLRLVEDLPTVPDAEQIEDRNEARRQAIAARHQAWARGA